MGSDPRPIHGDARVSVADIRRIAPALDDAAIAAVLARAPSIAEFEQAYLSAIGRGDVPGRAGHTLAGAAAAVYDILVREQRAP